jgi:hypothetical protein
MGQWKTEDKTGDITIHVNTTKTFEIINIATLLSAHTIKMVH